MSPETWRRDDCIFFRLMPQFGPMVSGWPPFAPFARREDTPARLNAFPPLKWIARLTRKGFQRKRIGNLAESTVEIQFHPATKSMVCSQPQARFTGEFAGYDTRSRHRADQVRKNNSKERGRRPPRSPHRVIQYTNSSREASNFRYFERKARARFFRCQSSINQLLEHSTYLEA